MACRRGDYKELDLLVQTGAALGVSDDFGRTPLHDACWTPEPCFDVIVFLLNKDLNMLRVLDKRGSSPLAYIRREHHAVWCAFLEHQKEVWWRRIVWGGRRRPPPPPRFTSVSAALDHEMGNADGLRRSCRRRHYGFFYAARIIL